MSFKGNEPPVEGMLLFERYMFDLRRDMGRSNNGMEPGDILSLFIKDIRSYIQVSDVQ
ncbi:hypothetical protein JW926_05595 [Candidatus Sumerlaeota bacterium]|nr:hypothetical protein [Candidatus Sumerlaeota bacterium]